MARQIQVGSVAISTLTLNATHTISLSGFSQAPNFMRFWIVGRSDAAAAQGRANLDHSIGFAIGAGAGNRYCYGSHFDDATANAQADHTMRSDCIIALMTHSATSPGTTSGKVDIDSVSSTQIVLKNVEALGHAVVIGYEVGVFTNAAIGLFNEPTTLTDITVSGLSFQPDYLEIVGGIDGNPGAIDTILGGPQGSFGVACSGGSAVFSWVETDGSASSGAYRYCKTGEVIAAPIYAGTSCGFRATLSSFNTDGFTIGVTERNSQRLYIYIALKGGTYDVDSFTVANTNGGTTARTGYGFRGMSALVFGAMLTAESTADTPSADWATTLGVADDQNNDGTPGTQFTTAIRAPNAQATMSVATAIRYDGAMVNVANNGTLNGYGGIQSFDSDGLTWVQTTATGATDLIIVRTMLPPDISSGVSGASSFGAGAQQTDSVQKRAVVTISINAGTQLSDSVEKRAITATSVASGAQLTDAVEKRPVVAISVVAGAQLTDAVQKRAVSATQMNAGSLFYSVGTSAESHSGISLFGIGGQLQSTVQKRGIQTTIVFAGGQLADAGRKQTTNASVTSAGARQTATVQKRAIALTAVVSGTQQSAVGTKGAISVSAFNAGSFFYSIGTSAESHSGTSAFGAGVFITATGQKRAVNVTTVRAGVFEADAGRKGATGYSQSGSAAGFNAAGSKSVTGASAFGSAPRFTVISVKGAKGQTVVGAGSRFSYTMRPPATVMLVASETVVIDVTPVAFHVERTPSVHWLSQDALVTDITPTVYVKEYK